MPRAHEGSDVFTVTVSAYVDDATRPSAACPIDMTVAANGPGGAIVTWTAPTASDLVDGELVPVGCVPASGSHLRGRHGHDRHLQRHRRGHQQGQRDLHGHRRRLRRPGPRPPRHAHRPDPRGHGASGAVATWTDPTVTDDVDSGLVAACAPASGSTFPLGATTVTCSVTDSAAHTTTDTFTVTVVDTTAPDRQRHAR